MIYLALALAVLILIGGRRGLERVGAGLQGALGVWRPTAGLGAVVLLVLALVLAVREDWLVAAVLGLISLGLAVSARWRRRRPAASGMNPAQARAILGVGPDAGRAEIQAAYRRLIQAVHPDRGGTRGLAAQLNEARAVLLRGARQGTR